MQTVEHQNTATAKRTKKTPSTIVYRLTPTECEMVRQLQDDLIRGPNDGTKNEYTIAWMLRLAFRHHQESWFAAQKHYATPGDESNAWAQPVPTVESIQKRLVALKEKGVSSVQIARETCLGPGLIRRIMRGTGTYKDESLRRLSQIIRGHER